MPPLLQPLFTSCRHIRLLGKLASLCTFALQHVLHNLRNTFEMLRMASTHWLPDHADEHVCSVSLCGLFLSALHSVSRCRQSACLVLSVCSMMKLPWANNPAISNSLNYHAGQLPHTVLQKF